MKQPCPEEEEGVLVVNCTVQQPDPVPPAQPDKPWLPAAVIWIGIVLLIGVFDLWAYKTGHETLSQFLNHHTGPTLKWIGLSLWMLLGVHLFWGGPL